METLTPPAVSRFEYSLLRILRFLLGHMPAEQVEKPLFDSHSPPPCLTRTCVRLVEDTLSKGLVLALVKAGGWRRDKFLRGLQPIEGRAWERHTLDQLRLEFGPHPLAFLKWLTAEKPTESKQEWHAPPDELTPADELYFAMAFDQLRHWPKLLPILAGKSAFRRNGLCWLMHPGDFGANGEPTPPSFEPWTQGLGAAMLECLQPALAKLWMRRERSKGQAADWQQMRLQGQAEFAGLSAFLAAVHKAGRPDLARFVLRTASAVLPAGELGPEAWTGSLREHRPTRLADRLETERAALSLVRQVETLHRWDRQARTVGYFDEEYAASQLWKAEWEAAGGEELAARAKRVLDQLEPLKTG